MTADPKEALERVLEAIKDAKAEGRYLAWVDLETCEALYAKRDKLAGEVEYSEKRRAYWQAEAEREHARAEAVESRLAAVTEACKPLLRNPYPAIDLSKNLAALRDALASPQAGVETAARAPPASALPMPEYRYQTEDTSGVVAISTAPQPSPSDREQRRERIVRPDAIINEMESGT